MVYDVSNLLAERERLVAEINWYNQQADTMWKRNEINKRVTRINQLDSLLQQNQMRGYQQQQQYPNVQYGYQQNMSPYANQVQMPPMNSPYQDRYSNIGFNQPVVDNSSNNRYANKPLPQDSVRNDPPASYRIESKPVECTPVKPEVKKYTSTSLYPLLCDRHIKEIERKLETGYYERVETEVKPANLTDPFILEKTKKDISSIEEFYNTFVNKLDFDKPMAFTFFKNDLYIVPNKTTDEQINQTKDLIKDIANEECQDEFLYTLANILLGTLEFIRNITSYNYALMLNDIMKYCYNDTFGCDDIVDDREEMRIEISKIKIIKNKEQIYAAFKHLAKQMNKTEITKVYDNKYLKIQLKTPTLLVYNKEFYGILNNIKSPMTLRKESFKEFYNIVSESFKYFGDFNKFINVIFVDHFFRIYNLRVYSHANGGSTQYIVTSL